MKTFRAKLVIIGPHNVGKTSVVTRYQSKVFQPTLSCTVGASFSNIKIETDEFAVKLQVWDTAGEERFRAITPMYYRGARGAILMFDLTDPESLENLELWANDLLFYGPQKNLVLIVAGNKCDMVDERRINEREGLKFAKKLNATYFETSAKVNSGLSEMFDYVGTKIGENLMSTRKIYSDEDEEEDISDDAHILKEVPELRDKQPRKCC